VGFPKKEGYFNLVVVPVMTLSTTVTLRPIVRQLVEGVLEGMRKERS
jgi:hypothetical protein